MIEYKESGLPFVKLLNGYQIKQTPYGESISIANMKELHKVIGTELIRKAGVLIGLELRFIRKEMELSQKALARILGVKEITFRKWESDSTPISKPADRLLRTLYMEYIAPESLARELIELLSQLDNEVQQNNRQYKFEVTDSHWRKKAI